jgi:Ca2+/Na+ antiporter
MDVLICLHVDVTNFVWIWLIICVYVLMLYRISYVQEPEQENLSILYYPCDLDEDHTKEKIIQKLVDHI